MNTGHGGVLSGGSKSHKNIPLASTQTRKKKARVTNTSGLYRSNVAPVNHHEMMGLSASSPLLTETPQRASATGHRNS